MWDGKKLRSSVRQKIVVFKSRRTTIQGVPTGFTHSEIMKFSFFFSCDNPCRSKAICWQMFGTYKCIIKVGKKLSFYFIIVVKLEYSLFTGLLFLKMLTFQLSISTNCWPSIIFQVYKKNQRTVYTILNDNRQTLSDKWRDDDAIYIFSL